MSAPVIYNSHPLQLQTLHRRTSVAAATCQPTYVDVQELGQLNQLRRRDLA
jgi:hypothetical protein